MKQEFEKLTLRLPKDVKDWIVQQSNTNAGTLGSEIVRAVREKMMRAKAAANAQAG